MEKKKSTIESGVISTIQKANPYPSSQTPEILHNYFKNGQCVQPEFDKSELFDLYKYCDVHANCINKTAKIATCSGFEFIDEENAKNSGVYKLIENLIDKDGNILGFDKLLEFMIKDKRAFGETALEIKRMGDELVNLYNLSTKNLYTNIERTKLYQINKYSQAEVVFEFNRNAENEAVIIRDRSSLDDFYGVPDFISAIPRIKTVLNKTEAINDMTENMAQFGHIFIATGGFAEKEQRDKVTADLKLAKSQKGSIFTYFDTDNDVNIRFESMYNKDSFSSIDTDADEIKIMASHQMNPEIYGYMTGGGITSGDKASGVFKMWIKTVIEPLQIEISKWFSMFFRNNFPTFKTELLLKVPTFEDILQLLQAEQTRANITATYKNLNSLFLLNESREQFNYPPITPEQWENMRVDDIYSFNMPENV